MTDNFGQPVGISQPGIAKSVNDGETTAVFAPFDVVQPPVNGVAEHAIRVKPRKRHVWPWIVLGVVAVLGAVCGGGFWFFQSHALPGVTLWGNPVMGQSHSHIAAQIDDAANNTTVTVSYEGKSAKVSLKDLGLSVDSDAIASDVLNAKRDGVWWQRYAFWIKKDVTVAPASADAASNDALNAKLSVEEVKPVDASVQLNADKNGFDVVAGQQGKGLDATPVAKAAIESVESLGSSQPKTVTTSVKNTDPQVTDTIANDAKSTLDDLIKNPVAIKVGDHQIASVDAQALAVSTRIDANKNGKLSSGEARKDFVVFDATKLQQYYDSNIKPTLKSEPQTREVFVDSTGKTLSVKTEGHDGVTIADNADASLGQKLVEALSSGQDSVSIDGTVQPMQVVSINKHVVVNLIAHTLVAYEGDTVVKTLHVNLGQDNDPNTGVCGGDGFCTPVGDWTIIRKVPNETMRGSIVVNGRTEKWEVPNVGFANYITNDGVAIHRAAVGFEATDADLARMKPNISHGCVGLGWDVAEWFYDWAPNGTPVHVQY